MSGKDRVEGGDSDSPAQKAPPNADGAAVANGSDSMEQNRSRERDHSREERRRDRSKDRNKDRHSRRDRDRDRDRDYRRRSKSRSRDRRRRSRSRDRRRSRSRDRRRSRSRDHHSRHRSRSRGRGDRRRSRSRSDEGVGGYMPRKRQEPAKPSGGAPKPASMFATNDPFAHLRSNISTDPAEAMRLWQEQMLKSRQLVLAQQAKSAVQQANKAQRELYIGNLTPGAVTDVMLQQVFDSALIAAYPQAAAPGQEPVVKVNIHSDGRYGFMEFRSAEYATAALQLNGQINLMGQALSIGRPASYVDPNKVNAAAAQAEAALAAFQSGAAPSIAAVADLAAGSAGANMAAAGNLAAAGHNAQAAATGAVPGALVGAGLGPYPAFPGPPTDLSKLGGLLVTETGASSTPTPFLCVKGMITPPVLQDREEYEEVILDLQEECSKHGKVYEVKIPRPADPAAVERLFGTQNYGKAYVQFVDIDGAAKARDAINGRMFAGNLVTVTFLTAQAYGTVIAAMEEDK